MKINFSHALGVSLVCFLVSIVGCGGSNPGTATAPTSATSGTDAAVSDSSTESEPSVEPSEPSAEPSEPSAEPSEQAPVSAADEPDRDSASDDAPQAGRMLPSPPIEPASANPREQDLPDWEPEGPLPEEIARQAFLPPPDAKALTKDGRLWVNLTKKRVYVDGYVALKRGPLEMFACPVGTKEHESIVAALARSRELHAALLAVDATPGTPVRFRPEFLPPTGQIIRIWVCWYDTDDQFHTVDAREWIEDLETDRAMTAEWVFAGSGFWQDEETKQEHYLADSGDMICVSNFSSALLDVAIPSSAESDSLKFVPFEKRIPEVSTPVRLVLMPVPFPTDEPDASTKSDVLVVPTSREVPQK